MVEGGNVLHHVKRERKLSGRENVLGNKSVEYAQAGNVWILVGKPGEIAPLMLRWIDAPTSVNPSAAMNITTLPGGPK